MSIISVALGLALLALPFVQLAAQPCNLNEQKDQRSASLELVSADALSKLSPSIADNIDQDDWLNNIQAVTYIFRETEFMASTPSCSERDLVRYPKHVGLSWLIEIPTKSYASILVVRNKLSHAAAQAPHRFRLVRNILSDFEKSREISISSTIDFVSHNLDLLFSDSPDLRPRLIVSAPYWKVSESGEKVIGFLKTQDNQKPTQDYVAFSAKHILCVDSNGQLELISPDKSLPDSQRKSDMKTRATSCGSAVQVGPSYFDLERGQLSAGISGLSLNQTRRNILIRLGTGDQPTRTFLWTIPSPVSPFDAMVVIEALSEKLAGKGEFLHWAVGLQDDKFMTGPLILDHGRFTPLTETDIQTGAFLVFFDSVL